MSFPLYVFWLKEAAQIDFFLFFKAIALYPGWFRSHEPQVGDDTPRRRRRARAAQIVIVITIIPPFNTHAT
jgi:hypothetical protein